ncbi:MAG: TonB-dependent receptor plug domain-containing protein [Nitrospiraceae bacterium]
MAAQVPQSFHDRPSRSPKPFHFHQTQIMLRVVLSMGVLCLLEIDRLWAQDQPDSERSASSDRPAESQAPQSSAEPESQPISELELLKEESVSIAVGLGREQPISEAPSNVYVITDEDIRQSGATDLPTVLRRIPGIDVMQMTGADFNVSVRGDNQLGANKLLVMIDGRSIYEDAYGSVFWTTLPITLPEIKRIEVLKGPASALYGFNAFDGVINIITKSPEEIRGTTLQVGAGEYGTIRAAAIQAGTYKDFGYRLSVGRDQNQQWRNRDALALRQNKVNLYTDYSFSDSKVSLQGGFLNNNRFDGQVIDILHETSTGIETGYLSAAYERANFFVRGWWTYWNHEAFETVNPLITPFLDIFDRTGNSFQNRTRNTYNIDAQHTVEIGSAHRLSYGANLRYTRFSSNFILGDRAHEDRLGFYVQDEWRVTKEITATAGLRYDVHSQINPTYSPRVSLLYRPARDHVFRFAGSVAYRPPTLYETFIESHGAFFPLGCPPFCAVAVPTIFQGSKDLKPEQIISYEVGYQGWYFKHRVRLRVDLFYNQISDLINLQAPAPSNHSKAEIYGGEAGVEVLFSGWLTGFANYSYQEISQTLTGTEQRGAPRFKASGGLRAEWENGLSGESSLNYVGSATYPVDPFITAFATIPPGGPPFNGPRVGSYILLNLRGGYKIWMQKHTGREAEVAVSVFNALNDRHQEHPLGDVLGSRVMGWLTVRY